jgi:glycine reductase
LRAKGSRHKAQGKLEEFALTPCAMCLSPFQEDQRMFEGKKAIILGERDGVPGPAIAACLEAAGAEIIFAVTECFV